MLVHAVVYLHIGLVGIGKRFAAFTFASSKIINRILSMSKKLLRLSVVYCFVVRFTHLFLEHDADARKMENSNSGTRHD